MRKRIILAAVVILALAASLVGQFASAMPTERSLGGPTKTTPKNLPVIKMPRELLAQSLTRAGAQGTQSGKGAKPPPAPRANKWAVVIGIADYQGTEFDLWHPDEDAKEMANALTANCGFSKNRVLLLLNGRATANAILNAIYWLLLNTDENSTVVFFYSGHGFRASDDAGWDGDTESDGYDEGIVSSDFYGIPDGDLRLWFSFLESRKMALCFGSCNSGGLFDDVNDLQAPGRVIASACKADQYAYDYFLLGNTLWGKYFVDEGLLQCLADLDKNHAVSIEEAHAYAHPLVIALQPDSEPQICDDYSGDLVP